MYEYVRKNSVGTLMLAVRALEVSLPGISTNFQDESNAQGPKAIAKTQQTKNDSP